MSRSESRALSVAQTMTEGTIMALALHYPYRRRLPL